MPRRNALNWNKNVSADPVRPDSTRVVPDRTKRSPRMTSAELMAEEMFFQNVCDIVENETETGTTFRTSKGKIN